MYCVETQRGGFIDVFCRMLDDSFVNKIKSKKKRKSKLETVPDTSSEENQYGYVHNSVRQKFHSLMTSQPRDHLRSTIPDMSSEFSRKSHEVFSTF